MRRPLACICAVLCLLVASPVQAAAEADADKDGLSDRLEALFKTDPAKADTDGDGHSDGREVAAGYSPLDAKATKLEKEIVISLSKQQMETRLGGIALAAYPVSTGLPRLPTPVGTFKVGNKATRAWSKGSQLWMPWWMQFAWAKGGSVGIHELPEWPNGKKEGADHLGKPVSHGCVRLGVGSAKQVYDWAPVGTKVTVKQ